MLGRDLLRGCCWRGGTQDEVTTLSHLDFADVRFAYPRVVVSTYLPWVRSCGFRRTSRACAVSGITLAVVLLAGCATTHPEYLAALNGDPLADLSVPGASLEKRTEIDAQEGGFMDSKRTNAAVLQVFRIDDSADADDVLAAAGEIAQENGWIIDSTRESGITAHKTLSSGRAELGIAFMPGSEGSRMVINLTASW